jgi:hypothetical protein
MSKPWFLASVAYSQLDFSCPRWFQELMLKVCDGRSLNWITGVKQMIRKKCKEHLGSSVLIPIQCSMSKETVNAASAFLALT